MGAVCPGASWSPSSPRQSRQQTRVQPIVLARAGADQLHLPHFGDDHLKAQTAQPSAQPRRMGSHFHRHPASPHLRKTSPPWLSSSWPRCLPTSPPRCLPAHHSGWSRSRPIVIGPPLQAFACFGLFGVVLRFFMAGLLFALRVRILWEAYRIPLGIGPLIPSQKHEQTRIPTASSAATGGGGSRTRQKNSPGWRCRRHRGH